MGTGSLDTAYSETLSILLAGLKQRVSFPLVHRSDDNSGTRPNLASKISFRFITGIKGRINISESTYLALQELREQEEAKSESKENYQEFKFEYRGEIAMKGKATPMKCWLLSRP